MMRFSTLIKYPADWMTGSLGTQTAVVTSRIRRARWLSSPTNTAGALLRWSMPDEASVI